MEIFVIFLQTPNIGTINHVRLYDISRNELEKVLIDE